MGIRHDPLDRHTPNPPIQPGQSIHSGNRDEPERVDSRLHAARRDGAHEARHHSMGLRPCESEDTPALARTLMQRDAETELAYAAAVAKMRYDMTRTLIDFEKGDKVYLR